MFFTSFAFVCLFLSYILIYKKTLCKVFENKISSKLIATIMCTPELSTFKQLTILIEVKIIYLSTHIKYKYTILFVVQLLKLFK